MGFPSSFILSLFFLENARERGDKEISIPLEMALSCLPEGIGEIEEFMGKLKMRIFHFEISFKIKK